jgi:hypothetical protein
MKKCFITLLMIGIGVSQVFASDVLGIQNSSIISLTGYYSSKGGDFYEINGDKQTTLTITPTIDYFVMPDIFIGLSIGYMSTSIGDESESSMSIGPNVGYMYKGLTNKVVPFAQAGFRYLDSDNISGSTIIIGFGLIIPASENAGVMIEAGYHFDSMEPEGATESYSGNKIQVGIGVAGFLQLF